MRLIPLAFLVLALLAGCGGSDTPESGGSEGCERVEHPEPQEATSHPPPTDELDPAQAHALTFDTSCGTFTVALDTGLAPKTAASLVSLAGHGYFDNTIFHRIVPGFVIQGGDPTQSGGGGPGYSTVDVPPADARYTKGTVAMAKTAADTPGTAGSQFFVVTADDAGLPPEYAIVGTVSEGLDVVERIGLLGDESEQPTQPVVIRSVTVSEG